MKIIFLSHDGEIAELVSSHGGSLFLCEEEDQVLEILEEVEEDETCLLFIDFDGDKKSAEKFNKSIFKNEWITRILITSELSIKELQKHQKGKTAAHGYVKKPLTSQIFKSILEDLNLSQVIEENEIFKEGQTLPEFDLEAVSSEGSELSVIEENDLEDEAFEESTADFGASEFKMNTAVRSLVDLHSVNGDEAPYKGELNDKIQAKFDSVFQKGDLPGFDEASLDEADDELEDLDFREEPQEKVGSDGLSAPGISLDLDSEDSGEEAGDDLNFSFDEDEDENEEVNLDEDEPDDLMVLSVDEADEDSEEELDLGLSEDADHDLDLSVSDLDESQEIDEEGVAQEDELTFDEEEDVDEIEDIEPIQALSPEEIENELEELTQNRDMPTAEELSEFEEETGDIEIPDELIVAKEEPPSNEATQESGEELPMSDEEENDDILEFDENEQELDDGELSFSTEPEENSDVQDEDEGGLDFDLGGIEEESEEKEESVEASADNDMGFELDSSLGDEGDVELDDPLASSEEDESSSGAEAEGVSSLGALEEELEEDSELGDSALDEDSQGVSDFDDEELNFSDDDEEEELEKTQAINLADVKKMNEDSADSDDDLEIDAVPEDDMTEDEVIGEDTGSLSMADDDLEEDIEDEIDEDSADEMEEDAGELQFGDEGDLLDDDDVLGDSTNPTMVMSDGMKQDLEDMVADETATEEFRPQGIQEETNLMDSEDLLGDEDIIEGLDPQEDIEEEIEEDIKEESLTEEIKPVESPAAASNVTSSDTEISQERIPPRFHEGEALRLQATIRQLREERESFLKEIQDLKKEKKVVEQENLGLKAELDEAKIEISILKKRHNNEIDEMRYRLRITDEKKLYAEEKVKNLQKEFDRLQSKVRVDFNHIKQREKELESQLELAKMDSESQVKSRDKKILELKRKIDQLEFNMENIVIREQKSRDDKMKLEDRLDRIMKTLRGSIEVIEEDRE